MRHNKNHLTYRAIIIALLLSTTEFIISGKGYEDDCFGEICETSLMRCIFPPVGKCACNKIDGKERYGDRCQYVSNCVFALVSGECLCPTLDSFGPFCQSSCPINGENGLVCSGHGRGRCVNGQPPNPKFYCLCKEGYSGNMCHITLPVNKTPLVSDGVRLHVTSTKNSSIMIAIPPGSSSSLLPKSSLSPSMPTAETLTKNSKAPLINLNPSERPVRTTAINGPRPVSKERTVTSSPISRATGITKTGHAGGLPPTRYVCIAPQRYDNGIPAAANPTYPVGIYRADGKFIHRINPDLDFTQERLLLAIICALLCSFFSIIVFTLIYDN
eukprot:Tbor_TRINITY_DN5696_c3_g4::TRINITY_DN5696_c3_g4_i1::g.9180::m.9180